MLNELVFFTQFSFPSQMCILCCPFKGAAKRVKFVGVFFSNTLQDILPSLPTHHKCVMSVTLQRC